MKQNECFHCGYHYQDEDDDFPCCHFDGFGLAPCEQEDEYIGEEY